MNFKDKELIIFDLDGTLIDSIPDLTQALNNMLAHYNLKPLTIEEAIPYVGNGARSLVERALNHTTQSEEKAEELFEEAFSIYFSSYGEVVCDKTYLYPGVLETLQYLDNKEYYMAICTNKPFEFIEPILETLSVKQFLSSSYKCNF